MEVNASITDSVFGLASSTVVRKKARQRALTKDEAARRKVNFRPLQSFLFRQSLARTGSCSKHALRTHALICPTSHFAHFSASLRPHDFCLAQVEELLGLERKLKKFNLDMGNLGRQAQDFVISSPSSRCSPSSHPSLRTLP